MSYGLKIKALRTYLNINQEDFSKRIGLTRSNLSQIERGKSKPKVDIIYGIVNNLHIPAAFFFKKFPNSDNLERMIESLEILLSATSDTNLVEEDPIEYSKISNDKVNYDKKAENVILMDTKAMEDFPPNIDNCDFYNTLPTINLPQLGEDKYIAFQITGDAMRPTIQNNDFVIGKWLGNPVRRFCPGNVYVIVDKKEGIVCRRLYFDGNKGVECRSDNQRFHPYPISWNSVIRVYQAVGRISFNFDNFHPAYSREIKEIKEEIRKIKQKR